VKIDDALRNVPGIAHTSEICGFSVLTGASQTNACTIFVILKPFEERKSPSESMNAIVHAISERTADIQEAMVSTFPPPPVQGIGSTGGFQLEVQDRGNLGLGELQAVSHQLMGAAYQQPGLTQVYTPLRTDVPQLYVDIDRAKVLRLGVPLLTVFNTLQTYLGAAYVNDFNFLGRTYQVNVQAGSDFRSQANQISQLYTRKTQGNMVPLSTLGSVKDITGPDRVTHYNLFTAADFFGSTVSGVSSGQAIETMQKLCRQILPAQMAYEWTGLTYQEIEASGMIGVTLFGLLLTPVFFLVLSRPRRGPTENQK
jgi:multidrug efflux pump subunit AcrB